MWMECSSHAFQPGGIGGVDEGEVETHAEKIKVRNMHMQHIGERGHSQVGHVARDHTGRERRSPFFEEVIHRLSRVEDEHGLTEGFEVHDIACA
jgi:hypothetical protein